MHPACRVLRKDTACLGAQTTLGARFAGSAAQVNFSTGTASVANVAHLDPMLKQVDLLSAHRVQQEDIVLKAA